MATAENSSLPTADSGRRIIAINPESNEEYELLELEELLAANPALAEQLQQQGTLSLALNAAPSEQVITQIHLMNNQFEYYGYIRGISSTVVADSTNNLCIRD